MPIYQTLVFALLLIAISVSPTPRSCLGDQPRNIVFILIDDLNHYGLTPWGLQTVGSTSGQFADIDLQTPAIDALARTGLRCDQAWVYPICEPTRVAMMSGMHNGRNFVYPKALHHSQITFSDVLKRGGYATGMYGKWKQTRGTPSIHGKDYISQFGWDDYSCFDVLEEGSRYIDPNIVVNGKPINYAKTGGLDPETGRRWYGPDIYNRAALKFIEDHQSEPFFLYYPLALVHDQHMPTPDTQPKSEYDNYDLKHKHARNLRPGDNRKYFPDMLAYTDKMVGKIVAKLDELNLRERTLVVVMGDNGAKECFRFVSEDGSVRIGRKGHNRDGGEHVGLIFNQPGTIAAGTAGQQATYDGLFDAVDVYSTLIDAAGLEIPNPDRVDSISAWPQISGRKEGVHRTALYKWFNSNRAFREMEKVVTFAQTSDFKRYAPHGSFPNGRFFDLRNDIEEEAGERVDQVGWENYHYTGLDVENLTPEQQAAYDELGVILEENKFTPVESIRIDVAERLNGAGPTLQVGQTLQLGSIVMPANATRNNIVWESSDPAVASINKFGELTAHRTGSVSVKLYSWDDALPVAAGPKRPEMDRGGMHDAVKFDVR